MLKILPTGIFLSEVVCGVQQDTIFHNADLRTPKSKTLIAFFFIRQISAVSTNVKVNRAPTLVPFLIFFAPLGILLRIRG